MTGLILADRLEVPADQPALVIEPDPSGAGWSVKAHNLSPAFVDAVAERGQSVLRVQVAKAEGLDNEDPPDMPGDYEILGDGIRFTPHFPFEPSVLFRAILDLRATGLPGLAGVRTLEFSLPREARAAGTTVSQVFPSGDILPENLLRFYVRFSNPMRRDWAEDHIALLGPDGRPVPDVLYRAPIELWDRSMTCLTVLLDPGRLKRGVGPNRMLGAPLEAGQRYTLAIASGMVDACGQPLQKDFKKPFCVSKAVRQPIAMGEWTIAPPTLEGCDPLELIFPRPLDWAELYHGIAVASPTGLPISGRIDIDMGETRWRFTPDTPWLAGAHSIHVAPGLEDICGNTPYAPFDGPFRSADATPRQTATRLVPFAVTSA